MKKRIFIVGGIILSIAIVCTTFFLFKFSKKSRITTIGFYNLPETYSNAIQDIIRGETKNNYKFIEINESDFLSEKIGEKLDILVGFNDANMQDLKNIAVELPKDVISRIPTTIKNSDFYMDNDEIKIFPIAIDLFETELLKTAVSRYEIPVPETVWDITKFGRTSKYYYSIPFVIAGAEDINMNSLLSILVASFGGKTGYYNVIKQLKNTTDFSLIYDYRIGGDAADDVTIGSLLNIIKDWQDKSYLSAGWTNHTPKQVESLIDDNRVSLCFMNLSEHRTKRTPNIVYYSLYDFPNESAKINVSVQPVVVGISFTNKEETRLAFNRLSQEKAQEVLSLKTKIGPAMLRGTSCDIQADDARYIAASTEGGPVPDLGTAALKTQEQRHLLAEAIRNYFE